MRLVLAIIFASALFSSAAVARQCNTSGGYIAEQPAPPAVDDGDDILTDTALVDSGASGATPPNINSSPATPGGEPVGVVQSTPPDLDKQTIRLDLSKDFTSLRGLDGRYTHDAPVLGLRLENLPHFNPVKHCNIIEPILYKPKIVRLPEGRIRASVDNERFKIEFAPGDAHRAWIRDADPSERFLWIFPRYFGARSLPALTAHYNSAYLAQPKGSDRRRWIAEAYLDIAVRYHRFRELNKAFPTGWRPARLDLDVAVKNVTGTVCRPASAELVCVASSIIEKNELAPPHDYIAPAAFVLSDALLKNSGLSAGIRQLDFASGNDQAERLVKTLFPTTLGKYGRGYGYRLPIRAWDVDLMNRWFDHDGRNANEELSRDEAKQALIWSHAEFLRGSAAEWQDTVARAYPSWTSAQQLALAAIGIDLENVTGYRLHLPASAANLCEVLRDRSLGAGQRTNASVARDQHRRLVNAKVVLEAAVPGADLDWSCISA